MTLMVSTFHEIRLTLNSAKVRRATYNGRDYLVAPLTLIVPGVLPGSKGPLYYPLEEIKANYTEWDWIPIVVNHPYELGQHVWATNPKLNLKILEKSGIGFLLKTNTKGGKLRSEGWFDIEHTQRIEPRIYEALITNTPIELSTGLGTTDEQVTGNCPSTGRPYLSIARNYRPDHLAVLPDQVGACSLNDGCGVLVNQTQTSSEGPMKSTIWMKLGELLGVTNSQSLSVTTNTPKKDEKGRFSGASEPENEDGSLSKDDDPNEPPEGSLAATLMKGKGGKIAMNSRSKLAQIELILNAKEEAGESNKTQGGTDTTKIDEEPPIEDAIEHEDDHQKPSQKKLAALVTENVMPFGQPPAAPAPMVPPAQVHEASKQASMASVGTAHEPVADHAVSAIQSSQAGNSPDAAAAHKKAASMHDTAATQSMKSGDMEGSDSHANAAMLHRKAASLHTACPMAAPTQNGGPKVVFNRKAAVAKLTANCKCSDDRAAFNKMSDATLQMLTNVGQGQATGGGDGGSIQAGGEEDDTISETSPELDPEKPKKAVKSKMGPEGGESTMNTLLQQATAKDRQTWSIAQRLTTNYQQGLVQRLIGHIKDDGRRKKMAATYNAMEITQLEAFVENMPPVANQQPQQTRRQENDEPNFNYLGAGGFAQGGITDNDDGFDKTAILPLPTINDLFEGETVAEVETA